jgi:hypothetical protein
VTCNLEKRSKVAAVLRANPNQPQAAPAPGVATKKDKRHGGLDTRNLNSNYDTTSYVARERIILAARKEIKTVGLGLANRVAHRQLSISGRR